MARTAQPGVEKVGFYEPQRNLPRSRPRNGGEARFVLQFAKAYRTQFSSLHRRSPNTSIALVREVPVSGYGIADLVAVAWPGGKTGKSKVPVRAAEFAARVSPTVRAFEVKMRDWRKALRQASRYRFFAHVPVAVLPANGNDAALRNLETFRILGVGLWTFDPDTERVRPYFTPRRRKPRDTRQHHRALHLVARATKALPVV